MNDSYMRTRGKGGWLVSTSELMSGIYFLIFITPEGFQVMKWVKR